jgi:hypothetical protein
MVATDKEKERQRLIAERQKRATDIVNARNQRQGISSANPLYGSNPFEPSAYLPSVPSDPALSQPLPSGRYIDPLIPSGAAVSRAADITDFRTNPKGYVQENIVDLNNEQSLIDKGKSMMSRIFDYRDEADVSVFGVNLSGVESVWDGFFKHLVGGFDLLNIGFGGLLSAAPGGVRTLSYNELSGGKSVGEVISGGMEPGSAPSPGQIAIASVAVEAKRIREGNARLSDVLLVNPATAPFILAALAAETSPLQKDGFNIMDTEQREKAFSSGYEQWMSGITDAGLMFADPLIGVGVGLKVLRLGLLGKPGSVKTAQALKTFGDDAVEETGAGGNARIEEIIKIGEARNAAQEMPEGIINRITNDPGYRPEKFIEPVTFNKADPIPEYKNPLARLFHQWHQVDDEGRRSMSVEEISRDPSFDGLTDKATIASLIHKSDSPAVSNLILQSAIGTPGAAQKLALLDAGYADIIFRYRREEAAFRSLATEPQKVKEASDAYAKEIANTKQNISSIEEQIRGIKGLETPTPKDFTSSGLLNQRLKTLQQNLDELTELNEVAAGRKQIDYLDPTSAFYRQDRADAIVESLFRSGDVYDQMLHTNMFDAAATSRTFLPAYNNAYSRMVMGSRERRRTARYQYSAEGTSILPKKVTTKNEFGEVIRESSGWFSKSAFEGTGRFERNIRVWRWMGAETPNGYIGLKGTATVGSEREFTAALNTELFTGNAVVVKKNVKKGTQDVFETVDDGTGKQILRVKTEEIKIGGKDGREKYFAEFYDALNNPNVDAKLVLDDIERRIANDYALAYGLDNAGLEKIWNMASKKRSAQLELISKRGYFVDPEDGTIQTVGYLDSQLANGTYMQNWHELEKILKETYAKDNGQTLKQKMSMASDAAGGAYDLFNNFWRPATLMRLSYTQRNIFEGTVRAMAYSASLAPLTWPVKGTVFGIRNKIVKTTVSKRSKEATEAIAHSEFAPYLREVNEAAVDDYFWQTAVPELGAADAEKMFVVTRPDRTIERLTETNYLAGAQSASDRLTAAREAVSANMDKFDAAVKNTAFGDWRRKNLKDLEEQIKSNDASLEAIIETAQDIMEEGFGNVFDDRTLQNLSELIAAQSKVVMDRENLATSPSKAMSMYRTQAGRQKRIGSGRSLGPDGGYYDDAFTGPYDQINRDLMSADGTVTQSLSLKADIWNSFFRKVSIRPNSAVAFKPGLEKQWTAGMADAIEEASSSWVVRSLVKNKWNRNDVLEEMVSTEAGNTFLVRILSQMGYGNLESVSKTVKDAYVGPAAKGEKVAVAARKNVKKFAEMERSAAGIQRVTVTDLEQARVFLDEVSAQVRGQMQHRPEFLSLLETRANEKLSGTATETTKITPEMVDDALKLIPEDQRGTLGYIQGSNIVQMGTDGVLNIWAKFTSKMFRALGTIPEDAITRGGFYNTQYKTARNILIERHLVNSGQEDKLLKGRTRGASNADQGGTISHGSFKISSADLGRIEVQAHRQALKDTREWMYTIERRTNLGKYGEWIFPFISATQNSATVTGKLLFKEPWLAPMIADLWRMPERLGIEDENGNLTIPMPLDWFTQNLKDNVDFPVIGGILSPEDLLTIPKDGLNVWMPETGFGIAPRPTPWIQVGASELMKANAFPIETPQPIKAMLGEENGNEFYSLFKDWIFGEDQGASTKLFSWDKLVPAYGQKFLQSRDELSEQYGYQYALHWHTQTMRKRAGERDDAPTPEEINKRVTNSFWFGLFGNQGIPTPLTPFPILTRPQIQTPQAALQEVYKQLQQADPLAANMNMSNMYGDWGLEAALTKVTKNVGGANPNAQTVSDSKTLESLIREVSPIVGEKDLSVLGILVNNRRPAEEYDQGAYNWQKVGVIPGTNREWREVQSPQEANAERQKLVGWTVYRKAIDQLDGQLRSAGLSSYELKAAAPYKAAKDRLVANMMSNPDYEGWIVDFQDRGGSKTQSAVRILETAIGNDDFRNLLIGDRKENLLGIMDEYVSFRRRLIAVLDQTGHSIEHESNLEWKIGWDAMRTKWRNQDERWAEIDSLYLSGDSNPQAPGNIYLQQLAGEQGVGR